MTKVTASKERDKFIKTSCGGDTISSFFMNSVNEMIVSLYLFRGCANYNQLG